MIRQFIISILLFIPVLIVQTTIVPLAEINGIVPDLILILLVFYTLKNGQIYGTILGFVYGFLFDLITGSLLGSAMLSKTLSGFVTGYFYNENKKVVYLKTYLFALVVLLAASIDSFIFSFFSAIDFSSNILIMIFEQGIFPGFYTAVISLVVIIFYPARRVE